MLTRILLGNYKTNRIVVIAPENEEGNFKDPMPVGLVLRLSEAVKFALEPYNEETRE